MVERDDSDDKITLLFPDGEPDLEPTDGDDSAQVSEIDESEEVVDEARSGSQGAVEEVGDDDANVVHLDFGRKEATKRSPRPLGARGEVDDPASKLKLRVFEEMIELGMVMVTLDTRIESVVVPPKFRGLSELRLNFSHDFHIEDFDYDEVGVRASLSFQGTRHFCDIPWPAVFMLYSHATSKVAVFEPEIEEVGEDKHNAQEDDEGQ